MRTWSAILKASTIDVLFSTIWRSLSLGIVISVSTFSLSLSIPPSAWFCLFLPSKVNGFVTTPTVRISISLATFATTGAAPVPVPPPIPAVINIISAPFIASDISFLDSSAAFSPTSGLAPAPSPLVSFSPIWSLTSAFDSCRVCKSVFNAKNSTPDKPLSLIRLIALFPPPPTPITLILAKEPLSMSMLMFAILSPIFLIR